MTSNRSVLRARSRELQEATKEFDKEMVVAKSRPLKPAERRAWEKARRKPGRPRRGAGVKVVSVRVERNLLTRTDVLARSLGISRASLIERGLKVILKAGGRAATRLAPETWLDAEETRTNVRPWELIKDLAGVIGGRDNRRSSRGTRALVKRLKKRAGRPRWS